MKGTRLAPDTSVSVVEALRSDLVIVDLTLKNSHGLDLVKDLHALFPKLPVLVYSAHPDTLFAERAIRAGANGYVGKLEGMAVLLQAIRQTLAGRLHLSEPLATRLVERSLQGKDPATDDPERRLSDRELQVWQLTGEGRTPTEIAAALRLERKTVELYRRSARKKLQLPSLTEWERLAFLESCLPVSSLARRNGMLSHGARTPLGFPA